MICGKEYGRRQGIPCVLRGKALYLSCGDSDGVSQLPQLLSFLVCDCVSQ